MNMIPIRKKFKIAGLGEVLWDIYDEQKFLGGAPANFAANVHFAGHHGIILSRVGNDVLGAELLQQLGKLGVDGSFIQKDDLKPTGKVRVSVDEHGIPSFECNRNVAFDNMELGHEWKKLASELDAVLFGTLAQREKKSRRTIHAFLESAASALKVFDVNLRGWNDEVLQTIVDSIALADVIKMNEDELRQLKSVFSGSAGDEDFLQDILQRFDIRLAAVTLGGKGCFLVSRKKVVRHPGFKVDVKDTTGSGDAFAAGLILKFLQKKSLKEMAEFGNLLGAFVATQKGAAPQWTEKDILIYERQKWIKKS